MPPADFSSRSGVALSSRLHADRFGDIERGLDLVEEFDLPGGDAQALAARAVGVGFEDPQRFFEQADALVARLDASAQFCVLHFSSAALRSPVFTAVSARAGGLSNMLILSHVRALNTREYAYIYSTFRISSDPLQLQLAMPLRPHIKAVE